MPFVAFAVIWWSCNKFYFIFKAIYNNYCIQLIPWMWTTFLFKYKEHLFRFSDQEQWCINQPTPYIQNILVVHLFITLMFHYLFSTGTYWSTVQINSKTHLQTCFRQEYSNERIHMEDSCRLGRWDTTLLLTFVVERAITAWSSQWGWHTYKADDCLPYTLAARIKRKRVSQHMLVKLGGEKRQRVPSSLVHHHLGQIVSHVGIKVVLELTYLDVRVNNTIAD